MNKYLVIIFSALLASCYGLDEKDESSIFYAVAKGSSLTLNQPLTIPPNRTTVILQYGKVVTINEVNIYHANCKFEIKTLSATSRTVHPDTFLIHKVVDRMMSVSLEHKMFASRGKFVSDASSDFNYTTTMYLESEQQPDVLRIACMHWENSSDNDYLTIEQMRRAMGEIFTLKLAQ